LEALTVREAGRLLSVSRPTVEKYIRAGELPSVRIARCRRIMRADLEAFLADRRTRGLGPAPGAGAEGVCTDDVTMPCLDGPVPP
jgi:excisionase family DNA binding protein